MDQVKVGKFIKKLRLEKKMTQQQLADLLGLSFKTISKWECGYGSPDISIINELSNVLGVSTTELLSGERNKDLNMKSNHYLKKRIVITIFIVLLLLSPLLILSIGELGKIKSLPSFSTILLKNKKENLFQALQSFDYEELDSMLNHNVALRNQKEYDYSVDELLERIKELEKRKIEFDNLKYEESTYGNTVYYNISVRYNSALYEFYYSMEYDKKDKKYYFLIWAPTHDNKAEIYHLIEEVLCPESEYFLT